MIDGLQPARDFGLILFQVRNVPVARCANGPNPLEDNRIVFFRAYPFRGENGIFKRMGQAALLAEQIRRFVEIAGKNRRFRRSATRLQGAKFGIDRAQQSPRIN